MTALLWLAIACGGFGPPSRPASAETSLPAPARAGSDAIDTIDKLWAGFDPRALPLEVEVVQSQDEGDLRLETIYFTGEVFEGQKTRVFGYLGRPRRAAGKLPGILHIHGGGQTANLDWPRFWARRGDCAASGARLSSRPLARHSWGHAFPKPTTSDQINCLAAAPQ